MHEPTPRKIKELNRLLADGAEIRRGRAFIDATIMSVGDLVRIVEACHHGSYQYRGVGSSDYELKPSLTRIGSPTRTGLGNKETWQHKEREILNDFQEQSPIRTELGDIRDATALEIAVLAQHQGLPTRLLDWTTNPVAALYFAVNAEPPANSKLSKDPVVWAIAGHRQRFERLKNNPFRALPERPVFFLPVHRFVRVAVQGSLFAVWRDPFRKSFDEAVPADSRRTMWRIVVPQSKRPEIRDCLKWLLHVLGINEASLFPDLEGLARHLKWKHQKTYETIFGQRGVPRPK